MNYFDIGAETRTNQVSNRHLGKANTANKVSVHRQVKHLARA